jgi:tRNA-dihydrouridine synthase B
MHVNAPPFTPEAPWLAPLAGYSDLPFRLLCREQGAACACTEMISAKGLVYESPGTWPLLRTCDADAPLVVQLFGAEQEFMLEALRRLLDKGYAWFDINAGCSVPKVAKTGAGAGLLRTLESRDRLCAMLHAMTRLTSPLGRGRVGVKLRLGWDKGQDVSVELGRRLQEAGAGWLTLHPRFARQGFSGAADWSALARLVRAVDIPVLASGDLLGAADGRACLRETGCHGLMFARGAMNDPRIFRRFLEGGGEAGERHFSLAALIRRHVALIQEHGLPRQGLLKMRTFVPRYLRGVPGAAALRKRLTLCTDWGQLEDLLHELEALEQGSGDAATTIHDRHGGYTAGQCEVGDS